MSSLAEYPESPCHSHQIHPMQLLPHSFQYSNSFLTQDLCTCYFICSFLPLVLRLNSNLWIGPTLFYPQDLCTRYFISSSLPLGLSWILAFEQVQLLPAPGPLHLLFHLFSSFLSLGLNPTSSKRLPLIILGYSGPRIRSPVVILISSELQWLYLLVCLLVGFGFSFHLLPAIERSALRGQGLGYLSCSPLCTPCLA